MCQIPIKSSLRLVPVAQCNTITKPVPPIAKTSWAVLFCLLPLCRKKAIFRAQLCALCGFSLRTCSLPRICGVKSFRS